MKTRWCKSLGPQSEDSFRKHSKTSEAANRGLTQTRKTLLEEYSSSSKADGHLLVLVLNEAEGLAWQTDFPYLVFPLLAAEKTQAALAWHSRQSAMNSADHTVVLIA